jgi:DnaJ-class molecular chaperone
MPATKEDVVARYRNLVKQYHPDTGGEGKEEDFLNLQSAYEDAIRFFKNTEKGLIKE